MDDDTHDLIVGLCSRIGMIMEDASGAALTIRRVDRDALPGAVAELEVAVAQIAALIAEVHTLLD